MRRTGLIAIAMAIAAATTGAAQAGSCDTWAWCRHAQAAIQSLIGKLGAPDPEIIAPSGDIDPKMALLPPPRQGTMRVIRPPASRNPQR